MCNIDVDDETSKRCIQPQFCHLTPGVEPKIYTSLLHQLTYDRFRLKEDAKNASGKGKFLNPGEKLRFPLALFALIFNLNQARS